ncbi:hypothetical protein MINTM005_13520 [Mycobacterium intracellulare]|uniref:glutaredoxin family protein n=1 Tax=Mycobacterium intracellulare TaxID=1767 RepID=UPI001927A648|nr:glutaredoxin family protein [Mycobacterium intracellulare]BCO56108.1 hypothetical protein MINTM005_13520 [Mycobacterium intracellulare]
MTIKVFSRPAAECVKCRATEISLRRKGIDVEKIMLNEDAEAVEFVKSLGHTTAPVVVVERDGVVVDHWSDFREDKIAALKELAVA